jgi:hypothetical protein
MTIGRLLLLLAAVTILCAYLGWLPTVDESVRSLLRTPTGPSGPVHMERDEALMLLFFCIFLAPFAGLAAIFFVGFVLALLSGLVRPLLRIVALPEALSMVVAVVVLATALFAARQSWMPPARWMVEVLARAYQVAFG